MVRMIRDNFGLITKSIEEKVLNQDPAEEIRVQKDEVSTVVNSFPGIVAWVDKSFNFLGRNGNFNHFIGINSPKPVVTQLRDLSSFCEGWREFINDLEEFNRKDSENNFQKSIVFNQSRMKSFIS